MIYMYSQDLDEVNLDDLAKHAANLVGIVDEDAGGIIAYATSPEVARQIILALASFATTEESVQDHA